MHIYVINLERRSDRKATFQAMWHYPTDNLIWFKATDWQTIREQPPAFKSNAKGDRWFGRAACYLSHLGVLEAAIQQNHFPLLVLEDDVTTSITVAEFNGLFQDCPDALLYFGALPVKNRKSVAIPTASGWQPVPPGMALYGGHAYGVPTAQIATQLLQFLQDKPKTFDSRLVEWQKAGLPTMLYKSLIFKQQDGYSDIELGARVFKEPKGGV